MVAVKKCIRVDMSGLESKRIANVVHRTGN